ncbi:MAG: acyl-CoA dehydrogenase [Candidatus Abyssobacteria bacterium SURF_17]|uniref:Acyl-CoA dehydrogenase n=1 Tax=Candidatus Abyssobacteria bacterium SURF_17 TaxID=2093361 RepID=A0A419EPT5_9BACT|nr:MAG: acyl-CoA dehydrogenase [Candidatus Abyssubacteria bacterium SURF_17]
MLSFSLTDEQKMLQETAHKFAEQEIRPKAAYHDKTGEFPREILQKAFDIGLMNETIPEFCGGGGLSVLDSCIIGEEMSWGCVGINTSRSANSLAVTPILVAATDEQKKKFLSPLCEKLSFAAFGLTEPGAGSDAGSVATTAKLVGDEYVLNGTKCFITNGGVADLYTIFASTDRTKGARGLSAFVVLRNLPGVSIGKEEDKMGQRASNTAEVVLEDVHIPKDYRLGKEGDGFKIAMITLDKARPGVAAASVGVARAALEYACEYAKQRVQFGQPIAMNQAIQFMIADLAMKVELARLMVYKSAWVTDQGQRNTLPAAIAKAFASDTAMEVATEAVQIYGGYGYMREYPVEKLMRDAKLLQIYEGTNQIQRMVIAREVLMPRG